MVRKLAKFDTDHHQRGYEQRQNVIDDAVKNEAAEHFVNADPIAQCRHDHRFEDAETGRHMAQDAEADSSRIDRQEGRPADFRLRQEHVENGGRGGDIERSDQELLRGRAGIRQTDAQAADRNRPAVSSEDHDSGEHDNDHNRAGAHPVAVDVENCADPRRRDQRCKCGDRQKPDAEGKCHERDDATDIVR